MTSVGWKDASAAASVHAPHTDAHKWNLNALLVVPQIKKAHLVESTCMAVCPSGHALIGDVQQHSQVQDQRCRWRSFRWTRINNELCPVVHGSFLNSSA